jgi:hypothetical protein
MFTLEESRLFATMLRFLGWSALLAGLALAGYFLLR